MSEISNRIDSILSSLDRVSKQMEALKAENDALKHQKAALELKRQEDEQKLQALTADYNRLKLAKTLVQTSGDKVEMKFKVNELVREIDKCIALLNR